MRYGPNNGHIKYAVFNRDPCTPCSLQSPYISGVSRVPQFRKTLYTLCQASCRRAECRAQLLMANWWSYCSRAALAKVVGKYIHKLDPVAGASQQLLFLQSQVRCLLLPGRKFDYFKLHFFSRANARVNSTKL